MKPALQDSLLAAKTYAAFGEGERSRDLPLLCRQLLAEQRVSWPDLAGGMEALEGVRNRDIGCNGFAVRLQYNPGRIRSTTAAVGEKKETGRSCFLCLDQLPQGQKGVLYGKEYLILCNPAPVLASHLTVCHVQHRPQRIAGSLGSFTRLMVDLGEGWTVLYNGPRCGASAPDHLHFQVLPAGHMPLEWEMCREGRSGSPGDIGGVLIYRLERMGRAVVVIQGDRDEAVLARALTVFLQTLGRACPAGQEPMINIIGFCRDDKLCLLVFPRRKHRPEAFFEEGETRIVVSPGVIDMGGLVITPLEKDFNNLDAPVMEGIFSEVSLDDETLERVMKDLK
jgi:hypothetical protein